MDPVVARIVVKNRPQFMHQSGGAYHRHKWTPLDPTWAGQCQRDVNGDISDRLMIKANILSIPYSMPRISDLDVSDYRGHSPTTSLHLCHGFRRKYVEAKC